MDNFIQDQPTINIGMLGSVSNGKTTITKMITGISTQKHSNELKQNLTIRLGYANTKIYMCSTCPRPICYRSVSSNIYKLDCDKCGSNMILKAHISLVDCPGHNMLMSTMLNGTCVMDGAILVESAQDKIPKMQTVEHLIATEIMGLDKIILCLNKMDLIKKEDVNKKYEEMKEFVKGTSCENSPIIPVSANFGINCDVICEYICKKIPQPIRDLESNPKMIIVRSFNVNKQGCKINDIIGGIIGGSIIRGLIKIGQTIEIRPGHIKKETINNEIIFKYSPIKSIVTSINSEKNKLEIACPGGLIALGLTIDPALTKNNNMVGSIIGIENSLPNVYSEINIQYRLLEKTFDENNTIIEKIKKGEILAINVNSSTIQCSVIDIKKKILKLKMLNKPVCLEKFDKISITRNVNKGWRLVGVGEFIDGIETIRYNKQILEII